MHRIHDNIVALAGLGQGVLVRDVQTNLTPVRCPPGHARAMAVTSQPAASNAVTALRPNRPFAPNTITEAMSFPFLNQR